MHAGAGRGASAAPTWAPASSATIHPGVQTVTNGGQCTSNFVFYDATNVYLGQAAHCSGPGGQTDTDGCDAASLPIGTPVDDRRRHQAGHAGLQLVDHDARARGGRREHVRRQRPRARQDRPGRRSKVNPSIPFWGGPTGTGARPQPGRRSLVRQLGAARRHHAAQPEGGRRGRRGRRRLEPPGRHGHAGHPRRLRQRVHGQQGRALGILSTLAIAPIPAPTASGTSPRSSPRRAHVGFRPRWRTAPSRSAARCCRSRAPRSSRRGADASRRRGWRRRRGRAARRSGRRRSRRRARPAPS